jgi:hypothetical protein
MSYDVWIGDKDFNYTRNISELIYDHIPDMGHGGGLREIAGKTGKEAVPILADAFEQMNRTRHKMWVQDVVGEPAMCAKYDAKNGWGSMVGGILFLGQIMGACAMFPDEIVNYSA